MNYAKYIIFFYKEKKICLKNLKIKTKKLPKPAKSNALSEKLPLCGKILKNAKNSRKNVKSSKNLRFLKAFRDSLTDKSKKQQGE